MMKRLLIFLILVAIALSLVACQAPVEKTNTTKTPDSIIFKDNFSDTSGGWDTVQKEDGTTGYVPNGYRIFVNKSKWYFWSIPSKVSKITDARIEVDTTKVAGPDENEIGIICRYKDDNNFYFLTIGSNGSYSINKTKEGKDNFIGMDKIQFAGQKIRTGNANNHLRADCIGNELSLYANGELLTTVTDTEFTDGEVGLIAGTYDTPGTDVLFQNFVVLKP